MRSAVIGFLNDHMAVGASPAERACAPYRRFPWFGPRFELGDNSKFGGREINVRIRRLKIQAGRDLAMVNGKNQLDQPRDAGSSFKVADIGFYRTDEQGVVTGAFVAKNPSQSVCFDRVAQAAYPSRESRRNGHPPVRIPARAQASSSTFSWA